MNIFKILTLLLLKALTTETTNATTGTRMKINLQAPRIVHLGSYLTLNCSFDIEGGADRVRVDWLKTKAETIGCHGLKFSSGLANGTMELQKSRQATQWTGPNWSSLTLGNVTANSSGWYYCEVFVEIPHFGRNCSNGTEVIVRSSLRISPSTRTTAKHLMASSSTPGPWVNVGRWVWVTVGVGSLMLTAVLAGGVWILCRRRRYQNKENPIYENMHPVYKNVDHPQPSPCSNTYLNPKPGSSEMDQIRFD